MTIKTQQIEKMIYLIRGYKVMLDHDLAKLYGVETRIINRDVQRNLKRFPNDFMFQLTSVEYQSLISHLGISKGRGGRRTLPYVFTENGVAMLSGVLNSDKAIEVNISIMRTFTKMRNYIANHSEFSQQLQELEKGTYKLFRLVFEQLEDVKSEVKKLKSEENILPVKRKKIGITN